MKINRYIMKWLDLEFNLIMNNPDSLTNSCASLSSSFCSPLVYIKFPIEIFFKKWKKTQKRLSLRSKIYNQKLTSGISSLFGVRKKKRNLSIQRKMLNKIFGARESRKRDKKAKGYTTNGFSGSSWVWRNKRKNDERGIEKT